MNTTNEFVPLAVSINDAAKMSGIGRTKLYEAFNAGYLKPRKLGAKTLIIVDDLRDYVNSLPEAA